MGGEIEILAALATLFTVVGTIIGRLLLVPKIRAETRKANADASHTEWGTLRDELARVQERVEAQDKRIAELEKLDGEREDREAELLKENRQLRQKVKKLENRIRGLEAIFQVGPTPPEMQAQLDRLREVE